jgi:hypothetical protein
VQIAFAVVLTLFTVNQVINAMFHCDREMLWGKKDKGYNEVTGKVVDCGHT